MSTRSNMKIGESIKAMVLESQSKWQKVGICKVSMSKKVILLAIFELEKTRWQIIDIGELLDLIAGQRNEVSIMERNTGV
jgi:hypothetical protein